MRCWWAGWRIGLPRANHVGSHPVGEGFRRAAAARHGQHHGDHIVLGRLQVPSVQAEEDDHGQEGDALVAIAVGMIGPEAVTVRCRQGCRIRRGVMGSLRVTFAGRCQVRQFPGGALGSVRNAGATAASTSPTSVPSPRRFLEQDRAHARPQQLSP